MARRKHSISLPVILGSVTVALSIALLVGWILIIMRNWELAKVTEHVWLLVGGIASFGVIMLVLVLFVVFLAREIREVRRQDTFIDSVTHELKSPLASLQLCVQTLERHSLPEEKRAELLQMMGTDIERLTLFVDHILQASRVVSGKYSYQVREIDCGALVRRCAEHVRERYRLPDDCIEIDIPDSLRLYSDSTALEVVLNNLIDNACKYSNTPVKVEVSSTVSGDGMVRIEVRDSGIGIPRTALPRVFERFYRVPGEEVNKRRGTGLGLFVVASLVKNLGGQVKASLLKAGGTSMLVVLPVGSGPAGPRGMTDDG
jgi:signal transduction histidine kinase